MEDRKLHLLVVGDEEPSRMAIAAILKQIGYAVSTASNGYEALDLIQGSCQAGSPYDLLVLDMMMPGMMGNELYAQLKKRDIHIPAIAITACGDKDLVIDLLEHGFMGYLDKPFSIDQISECLKQVLRRVEREHLHALEKIAKSAGVPAAEGMEGIVEEVRGLMRQQESKTEPEFGLDFARVLRGLRESHGLTLSALSKQIQIQSMRLHSYELHPATLPSWPNLKKLADFYGLAVSSLVYLAENPDVAMCDAAVRNSMEDYGANMQSQWVAAKEEKLAL